MIALGRLKIIVCYSWTSILASLSKIPPPSPLARRTRTTSTGPVVDECNNEKECEHMATLKPVRLLVAATVLAGVPCCRSPLKPRPRRPRLRRRRPPSRIPAAAAGPATRLPIRPRSRPWRRPGDKSATAPAKVNPLVGLAVFSSDGSKLGHRA